MEYSLREISYRLQGPGGTCDVENTEWGVCGDGLSCQCYQCRGCTSQDGTPCNELELDEQCHPPNMNEEIPHYNSRRSKFTIT